MATINGDGGNNTLNGTSAADDIFGKNGNDTIFGAGGNDSLYGGNGNDRLDGGGGKDLLDGGAGIDTAVYESNTTPVFVSLWSGIVSFPGTNWASESLSSIENISSGSGNDSLEGTSGSNVLLGNGGNDTLRGGNYAYNTTIADTLDGGAGIDTVMYDNWGADALRIDLANNRAQLFDIYDDRSATDVLLNIENATAGDGDDTLFGSAAANILRGGSGNDILQGAGGNDQLFGDWGDDRLWGQGGTDMIDGGDGFDVAVYIDNTTPVKVDLVANTVTFVGQSWAPETLKSIEGVETGSGKDTLLGNAAANLLISGGGNDSLQGAGGNDTLDGGAGKDTLNGGAGTDTASYASMAIGLTVDLSKQTAFVAGTASFTDTLISIESASGGSGADSLIGSAAGDLLGGAGGNDTVLGQGGADSLEGGPGNDSLVGGAGNDILSGGELSDRTYYLDYDEFSAVLIDDGRDTLDGGAGIDTVVVPEVTNYPYGDYYMDEWGQLAASINLASGFMQLDVPGSSVDVLRNIENVRTSGGNDHVVGSAAANYIDVGDGVNFVYAGGGNDTVVGGSVAWDGDEAGRGDTIYGEAGNDVIYGNGAYTLWSYGLGGVLDPSWDYLDGGSGNDTIYTGLTYAEVAGGSGADKLYFTDEAFYWDYRGSLFEVYYQSVVVLDYNPSDGDQLIIQIENENHGTAVFVGETAELQFYELGYQRYGDAATGDWGTMLSMRLTNEYDYGDPGYLTIDLVNYGGPISESDILFA